MKRTITEVAAELGVRPDTLRYYERTELISSAGRTGGGYRVYEDNVVDRVRFIKAAQRSGLRLRSIAELLTISDSGNCPCGHTADVVKRRITEVDAEIPTSPRSSGQPRQTGAGQRRMSHNVGRRLDLPIYVIWHERR